MPLQRSTHESPVDVPDIPATVQPGEVVDWPHPIAGFEVVDPPEPAAPEPAAQTKSSPKKRATGEETSS
ncbi:hypothetical protein QMK19_03700 [Streptomyces sp. H10-C2]|uniref:hypothetical protein n=1 Tax=unclassified Streptomyces TaxID=2593676 RepID=UPI0024BA6885|nr:MULTISPECIES: hypothetical protein [unclassified Streptomyces]MDJ0342292.1 hypothetical protein [Streptomyces sp. PH10-H1]MDJ0368806.1 hypothetical protein [Streptomyces sp. H10-C2]